MKMPDPIIAPITIIIASKSDISRLKPWEPGSAAEGTGVAGETFMAFS
jgi:hypothetical protein